MSGRDSVVVPFAAFTAYRARRTQATNAADTGARPRRDRDPLTDMPGVNPADAPPSGDEASVRIAKSVERLS